jgi:hypothetical protein
MGIGQGCTKNNVVLTFCLSMHQLKTILGVMFFFAPDPHMRSYHRLVTKRRSFSIVGALLPYPFGFKGTSNVVKACVKGYRKSFLDSAQEIVSSKLVSEMRQALSQQPHTIMLVPSHKKSGGLKVI